MSSSPTPSSQVPPALEELAAGFMKTQVLRAALKLGIADQLRAGPKPLGALAQAVGAQPPALYRLLRAAENLGLFYEPEPGTFALTDLGAHLRRDAPSGYRANVLLNTDEMYWRAWGELTQTIATGESAFARIAGMPLFEYFQQDPERTAFFDDMMTRLVSTMAPAVAAAYDFSPFRTIVDVGGGQGALLAAILRANSQARGVLFDLPRTVEGAQARMKEWGLSERCACVSGDFFTSVPSGDCLILSGVISDWTDEQSVTIFRNCRRAIAPEGRLLLVERLLMPEKPASPEAFLDLLMLVGGGGTGRSAAEYGRLLAEAGFTLSRTFPTGTPRSIAEARPV